MRALPFGYLKLKALSRHKQPSQIWPDLWMMSECSIWYRVLNVLCLRDCFAA
jgi:hypothetical protein